MPFQLYGVKCLVTQSEDWAAKKRLPTPTIKIGREVFAASSSRFAAFSFGRKGEGIKALFS
jgi:hypothetical protein